MKQENAEFLAALNRRKAARRRAVSLLLVLSMITSSGVSWALHGVGMTMANEPETEAESPPADETEEESAEDGVDAETDSTEPVEADLTEDADAPPPEDEDTDAPPEDEDTEAFDEADETEDGVIYESAEGFLAAGDGDSGSLADSYPTISTIDNIAEGIKFNLFDYGDSELESKNNNYYYQWSDEQNRYTHPNVKTSGINAGRNPDDDIMFFAYGTPAPWTNGEYIPDKNSYAGDYSEQSFYPGNRFVQGIVYPELEKKDGVYQFPRIAVYGEDGSLTPGNSLDYLFDPSLPDAEGVRKTYRDVNHLLKSEASEKNPEVKYLKYDSNKNYAYYDQSTGDFIVYDSTFEIVNKDHHPANSYDYLKLDDNKNPKYYETALKDGFGIGFFPFDTYEPENLRKRDPNYDGSGYNHHFGMTMEATFDNPAEPKEPITFKYSGDDDMWVFVDGKLVLDLGGIHEPAGGMIDFTNGLVWAQDNGSGDTMDEVRRQLIGDGTSQEDDDRWAAIPKPIGIDTSSSENKWKVTPITNYIPNWDSVKNKAHDINMFYLERGGCYSNLAMEMNLPTVKPLSVVKKVDYGTHLEDDFDTKTYRFQIVEWVRNEETQEEEPCIPADLVGKDGVDDNGFFELHAGERKLFNKLDQTRKFQIIECGIEPSIFDKVVIDNGIEQKDYTLDPDISSADISTDPELVKNLNAYAFTNKVREEFTDLKARKVWSPSSAQIDDYQIKFKIMRTCSDGTVSPVAIPVQEQDKIKMKRTFVLDQNNNWSWELPIVDGEQIQLPSRYGDLTYTYNVVEQNVPMGYKAAYSKDEYGTHVITNTNTNKTDIWTEKKWTHGGEREITLKLWQKRTGFSESKPTKLKVEIYDEGNNLLRTQTVDSGLYVGGSVEGVLTLPKGAIYLGGTAEPDTVSYQYENGFFEVSDLKAIEKTDVYPNVIKIRVNTVNADDSLLLVHHSFTVNTDDPGNTNGWIGQVGQAAPVKVDTIRSYAKGSSLHVSDRTKAWNGAKLKLDPLKFVAKKTYTFSAYIYSPVEDDFKVTFNNGLGEFKPITNPPQHVPANTWTPISGTVDLSNEIDPYNMFIVVESIDADQSKAAKGSEFWMDEFVAVENTTAVQVAEGSGTVSVSNGEVSESVGAAVFNYNNMRNYGSNGWYQSGSPKLSEKQLNGNYAVVVENREKDYYGIDKDIRDGNNLVVPGGKYQMRAQVAGHPMNGSGSGDHPIRLVVKYTRQGGSEEQHDFGWATSNNTTWVDISGTFTLPEDVDLSKRVTVGFAETGVDDAHAFEVWSARLNKINVTTTAASTEQKPGYYMDTENGKYVEDYSNYIADIDLDSATNPLHRSDTSDTNCIATVKLNAQTGWTYHWSTDAADSAHMLNEEPSKYIYEYWIEEESLGEDYLVSYEGNNVSTNTEDSPITVSNYYIWYRLPATGGVGTDTVYGAGVLLILTGFMGGYALKKRERRYK